MPYTDADPMNKAGADLSAQEHMQCATEFNSRALEAMQGTYVGHQQEASRGL